MTLRKFHIDGTLPKHGEIFVFGSNTRGIHGAGAAKIAKEKFGAQPFVARGVRGQSYALPTRTFHNQKIVTLELDTITRHIMDFVTFTQDEPNRNLNFFVTRVACGLAGFPDSTIAPLFRHAINCNFAADWKPFLKSKS